MKSLSQNQNKIFQIKKKKDFFNKVYDVTKRIPYGKVATYGDIAEACGIRSSARTVGWALNGAKEIGKNENRMGKPDTLLCFSSVQYG